MKSIGRRGTGLCVVAGGGVGLIFLGIFYHLFPGCIQSASYFKILCEFGPDHPYDLTCSLKSS